MGRRKDNLFSGIRKILYPYTRALTLWMYRLWLHVAMASRRKIVLRRIGTFFRLWVSRIIKEKVPRESGSLAYVTILGFIPFITFILMLAPDLPFLNLKEKIADVVAQNF